MLGTNWGADFMYGNTYYRIPKKHFELIKTLKGKLVKSYYANKVLIFDSIDNPQIELEDFKQLSITINFLLNYGELSDEFIKKYDVKSEHIALMRRCYIEQHDSFEDTKGGEHNLWSDDNRFAFGLGYKRPYGNSFVEGDILEEWLPSNQIKFRQIIESIAQGMGKNLDDYDFDDIEGTDLYDRFLEMYDNEIIWDVHFKAMDIMEKFLNEETFNIIDFEKNSKNFFGGWSLGKKTMRSRKLKKLC